MILPSDRTVADTTLRRHERPLNGTVTHALGGLVMSSLYRLMSGVAESTDTIDNATCDDLLSNGSTCTSRLWLVSNENELIDA
jgi:hypothetical protein